MPLHTGATQAMSVAHLEVSKDKDSIAPFRDHCELHDCGSLSSESYDGQPSAGEWVRESMSAEAVAQMKVFEKGSGIVILQLNASASDHEGVHNVEVRVAMPILFLSIKPRTIKHAMRV